MKRNIKTLLFILLCAFPLKIAAQVTIGSVASPASYSLLELDTRSVKSGLRLPQLKGGDIFDFKERAEIDASNVSRKEHVEGLTFFNLETHCIEYWNGEKWQSLCGDSIVRSDILEKIAILRDSVYKLNARLEIVEGFLRLSDVTDYKCPVNASGTNTNIFNGLGVSAIYAGYNYNFWGTGAAAQAINVNNATTYYLLRARDPDDANDGYCKALTFYVGNATIGTLWTYDPTISNPANRTELFPIYFNHTGIYVRFPNSITFGIGTTFMFTQSLILVDPSTIVP